MTHSATTGRRAEKTANGEGEAYWFYGDRAILRSPEGAVPVIIEHHVGPGAAAPLHVHHDVDDSFYLLSGQLAMRCGDDTFVANAGDYVSLPKGVPHALCNVGTEEAVLLQTHDADSFLTFIRHVGVPGDQELQILIQQRQLACRPPISTRTGCRPAKILMKITRISCR